MYLTRCEINTSRRASRDLLASPQKMHGTVMRAFPASMHDNTDTSNGRILWRIDQQKHQTMIYIVSPHKPDLTHLIEQAGWPTTQGWDTREYAQLLNKLAVGQKWQFRLKANPTQSRLKSPDAKHSQRFGHVTVAQQTEWLISRTDRLGFTIPFGEHKEPDVAIHGRHNMIFKRKGTDVTLHTATYEGRLEITDLAAVKKSLINGIGPAKGYGCGLLTLAPIRHA